MTKLLGVVDKITFIENVKIGMDLCTIRIGFDEFYIFYDMNDLNIFLNENVEYSFREDMVKGKIERVITDIAIFRTIQTVDSIENVKLIPEGNKRTVCNFSIKEVRFGEFKPGCVSYLCGTKRGSSPYSKWIDMDMIDADSRSFKLRIFTKDPNGTEGLDEIIETFVGKYVTYDLQSTQYGYQTKEVIALTTGVELSPEVTVAEEVVRKVIQADKGLVQLESTYNLIESLKGIIDGEPGYQLVRMASEIYLINAMDSISTNLDINTMKQAVICSRLYCLPSSSDWSRPLLNVNKTSRIKELKENRELMSILDPMNGGEVSDTKRMYIKIRGMVNDIINIRRGVSDEKDNTTITGYMSLFNGLL